MAKAPGSKKATKKAAKKARAAKRPQASAQKKKAATKKAAKKAAKKSPKKPAAKKKIAPKKAAARKAAKSASKPTSKSSASKALRPKAPRAAKPVAAISVKPKLPAHRALTAGVVMRNSSGTRPRSPDRAGGGKPGRALRKVNLRTGIARPASAKRAATTRIAAGPWPALDEAASETGLRERILVYVLAAEAKLGGRQPDDSLPDSETAFRCVLQIWQWLNPQAALRDGRVLGPLLLEALVADEMSMLRETIGPESYDGGEFARARAELLAKTLNSVAPEAGI